MRQRLLLCVLCILSLALGRAQEFDNYQKTWATYFGGSGTRLKACVIDTSGDIIAVGEFAMGVWDGDEEYFNQFVTSEDPQFAYDPILGNGQNIIVKFSQDGDLLWSGCLPFQDNFIKIDSDENLYISGNTKDPSMGTPGVWEETPPALDGDTYSFLAKL